LDNKVYGIIDARCNHEVVQLFARLHYTQMAGMRVSEWLARIELHASNSAM